MVLSQAGRREDVEYYIPHRVDEGYGVNSEALIQLVRVNKAELIITVDCGISAVPQARLAKDLGVELIITDHHTIGPELPDAAVLVHPRLPGSTYPFGDLCGCGVAFKVAWQVCKAFGDGKKASPHLRDFLMTSLSHVALASVADVVPITGENRLLVKHGLGSLAELSFARSPGSSTRVGRRPGEGRQHRSGRIQDRPADQRRRPARACDAGRRAADDRGLHAGRRARLEPR